MGLIVFPVTAMNNLCYVLCLCISFAFSCICPNEMASLVSLMVSEGSVRPVRIQENLIRYRYVYYPIHIFIHVVSVAVRGWCGVAQMMEYNYVSF